MKIKVLKPTLVKDSEGHSCIATVGMVVEVDDNRGKFFVNSSRAKMAGPNDKLSKLQRYETSKPKQNASEAAEIGKAIAEAIKGVAPSVPLKKKRPKKAPVVDESHDDDDDKYDEPLLDPDKEPVVSEE